MEEREAAMYLARFTLLARTRPWIRGVWWYDLIDDGDSDTSVEQRFGLVRRSLAPKPALRTAKSVAALLNRPSRIARIDSPLAAIWLPVRIPPVAGPWAGR